MIDKILLDFLPETVEAVTKQLITDQYRWGDTWKYRPVKDQEQRAFVRFRDYYDQWKFNGTPIPWEKIIGEAHICMTRQNHPEELIFPKP